jgi:hypothetical protein
MFSYSMTMLVILSAAVTNDASTTLLLAASISCGLLVLVKVGFWDVPCSAGLSQVFWSSHDQEQLGRMCCFRMCCFHVTSAQVIDLISLKPFGVETIVTLHIRISKQTVHILCCHVPAGDRPDQPEALRHGDHCSYTQSQTVCTYMFSRAQVIDLISLKPFDMETISKSIKKTRKALIVEECMKTGGIGASLSAVINESLFDELDHQVRNTSCNMLHDMRVLMCLQKWSVCVDAHGVLVLQNVGGLAVSKSMHACKVQPGWQSSRASAVPGAAIGSLVCMPV